MSIWNSLSLNARISIVAFIITMVLGLLSMGALGMVLYYPVAPLLNKSIDTLQGDRTWPTVIMVGMLWSFGFLLAAGGYHYSVKWTLPGVASYFIYGFILWLWALVLWYLFLNFKIVQ
jgi:hypothetical protein